MAHMFYSVRRSSPDLVSSSLVWPIILAHFSSSSVHLSMWSLVDDSLIWNTIRWQLKHIAILSISDSFPIGGDVTCHVPKLTNSLGGTKPTSSLGKQHLELPSTRTWWGLAPWNCGKSVSQPSSSKHFFRSLFYFWVEKYNKTLNDWPQEKQWVLSPLHPQCSNVQRWGSRGNKTRCFPRGQLF